MTADVDDYRYDPHDGIYQVFHIVRATVIGPDGCRTTTTTETEIGAGATVAEAMHIADQHRENHR